VSISRITLAGTPAAKQWEGTSFVTTAPAATTALSPIVTPFKIMAPTPIQTWFSIVTGADEYGGGGGGRVFNIFFYIQDFVVITKIKK
jgi:hypothetical protein